MKNRDKDTVCYYIDGVINHSTHYKIPVAAYSLDEAKRMAKDIYQSGDLEMFGNITSQEQNFNIEEVTVNKKNTPTHLYKVVGQKVITQIYEVNIEAENSHDAAIILENMFANNEIGNDKQTLANIDFNCIDVEPIN